MLSYTDIKEHQKNSCVLTETKTKYQTTNVCSLTLNVCGSSAWNVRYFTVLETVIISDDP